MPVRDFVDSTGVEWRAWEVAPDAIYPPTRGEDYLADCYQLGWVVMETKRHGQRHCEALPTHPVEIQRVHCWSSSSRCLSLRVALQRLRLIAQSTQTPIAQN